MQATTTFFPYKLGDTEIKLEHFSCPSDNGLVYFHPHENEEPSNTVARKQISTHGGEGYFLHHGGDRLITFMLKGKKYLIDPNRMFSLDGIRDNLKKYGNFSEEAAQQVYRFALWLSGVISSGRVFAVHNNRNQGYNVSSYLENGKPVVGVDAIHISPKRSTGNFIYTNNMGLFSVAKDNDFNVVLQGNSVVDDGSYSVFAQKHGIDYINVEATIGDSEHDEELIKFVNRYYGAVNLSGDTWQPLKKGDIIDLVAPSSAYDSKHIDAIQKVFCKYGLQARTKYAKQEKSPLGYSAPDEVRLEQLIKAIQDPESKAVWSIRGGAGATNLLPQLLSFATPKTAKPLIGFSDTTALHLFLNSKWNWSSIHGVLAEFNTEIDKTDGVSISSQSSLKAVIDILMGVTKEVTYADLKPLNTLASNKKEIKAKLLGGNLTLVSTSLGTPFAPNKSPYILILEDVGNNLHQLERRVGLLWN